MNSIMKDYYPVFKMYQDLRNQLMDILNDEDLRFQPFDESPTLGYLCKEIGEVEYSYIQSFKTFKLDFSYTNEEIGLEENVEKLSKWYAALDEALKKTVQNLSEDDIQNRRIDRGGNFLLSPHIQLDVYKEALLIFYGKISVYLRGLHKSIPQQWLDWIG